MLGSLLAAGRLIVRTTGTTIRRRDRVTCLKQTPEFWSRLSRLLVVTFRNGTKDRRILHISNSLRTSEIRRLAREMHYKKGKQAETKVIISQKLVTKFGLANERHGQVCSL